MNNFASTEYTDLSNALAQAGVTTTAAEAHGIITAALCAPSTPDWQRLLLGNDRQGAAALNPHLSALYEQTGEQLLGIEFEFAPLLPTGEPLAAQVDALGEWCRGFLLGLDASGVDARSLPGEAGEFVADAAQIAEAEMDTEGDAEEQEREFAEIVEYLRVGVQLVYEEFHGVPRPQH